MTILSYDLIIFYYFLCYFPLWCFRWDCVRKTVIYLNWNSGRPFKIYMEPLFTCFQFCRFYVTATSFCVWMQGWTRNFFLIQWILHFPMLSATQSLSLTTNRRICYHDFWIIFTKNLQEKRTRKCYLQQRGCQKGGGGIKKEKKKEANLLIYHS